MKATELRTALTKNRGFIPSSLVGEMITLGNYCRGTDHPVVTIHLPNGGTRTMPGRVGDQLLIPDEIDCDYGTLDVNGGWRSEEAVQNTSGERVTAINDRWAYEAAFATGKCGHKDTVEGTHYGYTGSVAVHPYTHEDQRAHGGVTYRETCRQCGASRMVNSNGRYQEVGPWSKRQA